MIGVLAPDADAAVLAEFFELFKTPWELLRPGVRYPVVLATIAPDPAPRAPLTILYTRGPVSPELGTLVDPDPDGRRLLCRADPLPIYGAAVLFGSGDPSQLCDEATRRPAVAVRAVAGGREVRIGYDLVAEVRLLLSRGQPEANASFPTLDRHIGLLRSLILEAGLPLVEVPPVPDGHPLIACLTHDVDHPLQRNHGLDHTTWGFLFRATVGSALDLIRGRRTAAELARNLAAALRLPFVLLGWAKDPWQPFDRYLEIEEGARPTFFLIPFSGRPGRGAPAKRAARYELEELRPQLSRISAAGAEIGVHGIDAWADADAARAEGARVESVAAKRPVGVRMHWLYFREESPAVLESAGFDYDSTVGYNSTVGFRAGTLQAFRPPGCHRILELPLHIMDTALFYPSYLHLRPPAARLVVDGLIDTASRLGGALTFNWHDRSIAPERLWGEFHAATVRRLKERKAWLPTAGDAVSWFQARRQVRFTASQHAGGGWTIELQSPSRPGLPGLVLRQYRPGTPAASTPSYFDVPLSQKPNMTIEL